MLKPDFKMKLIEGKDKEAAYNTTVKIYRENLQHYRRLSSLRAITVGYKSTPPRSKPNRKVLLK
tara:strand:- start:598 stop:789 length:192 start_codon:yes stop_codon:yes gene_type:complete